MLLQRQSQMLHRNGNLMEKGKLASIAFLCCVLCLDLCSCSIIRTGRPKESVPKDIIASHADISDETARADTVTEKMILLPEMDREYILTYGNPDPTPYYGGLEYEQDGDQIYYEMECIQWTHGNQFVIACMQDKGLLRDAMLYRYASVEYHTEEGEWKRLSHFPEGIEYSENRWDKLTERGMKAVGTTNPGDDLHDYMAKLSYDDFWNIDIHFQNITDDFIDIGNYRAIVYVSGKTAEGMVKNLKYVMYFAIETLNPTIRIPE